jgi:hypothetical protein
MTDKPFEISLEGLEIDKYTKKQLQDENVKYGLARCENELKEKSFRKLKEHLEKLKVNKTCTLQIDTDIQVEYIYPSGKTRLDLNRVIHSFFKD